MLYSVRSIALDLSWTGVCYMVLVGRKPWYLCEPCAPCSCSWLGLLLLSLFISSWCSALQNTSAHIWSSSLSIMFASSLPSTLMRFPFSFKCFNYAQNLVLACRHCLLLGASAFSSRYLTWTYPNMSKSLCSLSLWLKPRPLRSISVLTHFSKVP